MRRCKIACDLDLTIEWKFGYFILLEATLRNVSLSVLTLNLTNSHEIFGPSSPMREISPSLDQVDTRAYVSHLKLLRNSVGEL